MNEQPKRLLDTYALNEAPGYLIRLAQQRAVDLFVEEVGEDGPTPRQFAVLLNVYQSPGMSQTALVRASGIDRSTLTEILRRMIDRGLISRTRLKQDRRANALTVTPTGEALLLGAFDATRRAQERIVAPLPPGQRAQAMSILAALAGCGNPEKDPDLPAPPGRSAPINPDDAA